jgi:hypothetical protein
MATNCASCGCSNQINCGCKDSFLTSPPPCPTPVDCPAAQPCAEVFDAQCVVYTGLDIECGTDTVVATNDSVATALQNVVDYFCTKPAADITVVEAGDNVSVDTATVGNTTTYTVNAIIPCPMDVTIIDSQVVVRGYFADVTGGTAPYTYQWSLADNGGLAMLTTTNGLPDIGIGIDSDPACRFDTGGNINGGTMSLLKVTVTDANGCIAKDTFMWIQYNCGV